jgi:pentatricopeptide repeat protein
MEIEGIPPSAVTMCNIIKACGDTGSMEATEKLHVEAGRQGFLQTDLFVGSALVDAYCKCGALSKAREVFDGLLIRNHVTWSTLITGCAKQGDVANAILTLTRMMDEGGHEPDHATFVSILNAFDGAGYVDEGHAWLMTMVQHWEMPPSMSHYACMIDLMARAGQLEKALMMIMNIPCPPDSHMWLSIMAACHTWGHVDLSRQAFEHAVQLDAMDVAAHVSMANTFAQADVFMHSHHDLAY